MGLRTFVGFGFGAIQAGLFLHEAMRSGAFRRLVAAEVIPEVVEAVRRNSGWFTVQIAHFDRVEAARVGPVEMRDPACEPDREMLAAALAEAEEIATAVPSVRHYVSPGPGSLHRILAEGLRRKAAAGGPRAVVYAAENHNHAAEILEESVLSEIPAAERADVRRQVRFLNTVIGKMSGVVAEPEEMDRLGLVPLAPGAGRAFLVEAFNRILISHIDFGAEGGPFQRGIRVFAEKVSLLPFEEAKLYGHNAVHALAAYVGAARGAKRVADLSAMPEMMAFLREAFLEESGEALVRRHSGIDPLFTREGYAEYADDLLRRMTNPYLGDTIERVGRDPARKLGWDDRLVGTMRVALSQGVEPKRFATGVAAALVFLDPGFRASGRPASGLLDPLWIQAAVDPAERSAILRLVEASSKSIRIRGRGRPSASASPGNPQ